MMAVQRDIKKDEAEEKRSVQRRRCRGKFFITNPVGEGMSAQRLVSTAQSQLLPSAWACARVCI
jgi:hypothetical protein